jgi:sortase A
VVVVVVVVVVSLALTRVVCARRIGDTGRRGRHRRGATDPWHVGGRKQLLNVARRATDSVGVMSPRRVIAAIGRSLITAGVLLLLFVAYQLWGTGIAHAQRQNKAEKAFEAALAAAATDPAQVTTPPDTTPVTEPPAPTTVSANPDTVVIGDVTSTLPPVTTSTLPKVRAGRSKQQRPAQGKVLGRLVIKRIKLNQLVVEGSDKESLKTGPGHYQRTPMPGQPGNSAIACHRTTYGAPCFNLHLLKGGDEILVQTLQGSFRYLVQKSWRVGPKDSTVLADTPEENVLTLTTCDPQYSAARRLIVRAVLDGPALPSDLYVEPDPVVIPPTVVAPETEADGGDTIAFDLVTDSVASSVTDATPTSDVVAVESPSAPAAELQTTDPEGTGPLWSLFWFHGHRSTWVAMLGFAAVCAAIWLAVWRLARKRRFIGQALIYLPAFVVFFAPPLFFCFENVARLLPDSV